jgi:hypothetical protein
MVLVLLIVYSNEYFRVILFFPLSKNSGYVEPPTMVGYPLAFQAIELTVVKSNDLR